MSYHFGISLCFLDIVLIYIWSSDYVIFIHGQSCFWHYDPPPIMHILVLRSSSNFNRVFYKLKKSWKRWASEYQRSYCTSSHLEAWNHRPVPAVGGMGLESLSGKVLAVALTWLRMEVGGLRKLTSQGPHFTSAIFYSSACNCQQRKMCSLHFSLKSQTWASLGQTVV